MKFETVSDVALAPDNSMTALLEAYASLKPGELLKITLEQHEYRHRVEELLRSHWRKREIPRPEFVRSDAYGRHLDALYVRFAKGPAAGWSCNVCGVEIKGGVNAKYEHFKSCHPQYAFERTGASQSHRYHCSNCGQRVNAYQGLVVHYDSMHTEEVK